MKTDWPLVLFVFIVGIMLGLGPLHDWLGLGRRKENLMIKPTVGRVVWFYRHTPEGLHRPEAHQGPLAAIIADVHDDDFVALMVIGKNGEPAGFVKVRLVQDGPPPDTDFCTWMPYQKGQAKKVEDLEKQLTGQPKADG